MNEKRKIAELVHSPLWFPSHPVRVGLLEAIDDVASRSPEEARGHDGPHAYKMRKAQNSL